MLIVNSRVRVPRSEFEFSYARSSGPGGQNVNKVSSKAILRWGVLRSPSLPQDVRERFVKRFSNRLTVEGDLLVTSQRFRDQSRNIADCLEKLRHMLAEVAVPPVLRKRTRPTRSSGERRLEKKRQASGKKQSRRRPTSDE
jgi:ribosome-associated protein